MNADTKPRTATCIRSLILAFASLGVAFVNSVIAADGQGKGDAKPRTIQIMASDVKWEVDGKPVTELVVLSRNKLIWMNTAGDQCISFPSKQEAEGVLRFNNGGSSPELGKQTVDGNKFG